MLAPNSAHALFFRVVDLHSDLARFVQYCNHDLVHIGRRNQSRMQAELRGAADTSPLRP